MTLAPRLDIDLDAIVANWRALDALTPPDCETAAVLKADAYGCGAARVARALAGAGARRFFVAHLEEGTLLRAALGPGPAIHVLNGLAPGEVPVFRAADLRPVLSAPAQVRAAAGSGLALAVQIDTGMNRLGLEPDEIAPALAALAGMRIELVMSHLHSADLPGSPASAAQLAAFRAALPLFPGAAPSLAATGGILLGPAHHFAVTRPGIGLFGGLPFAAARPVAALHVPVLQVRAVAPGEAVGYGGAYVATRPTRIATIAAGYADGIPRSAGGRGAAFFDGIALPFAGRVSMDLITLDATAAPRLAEGDMVELLGPSQGVDALASAAGTIGYEILTSLGRRFALRYKEPARE